MISRVLPDNNLRLLTNRLLTFSGHRSLIFSVSVSITIKKPKLNEHY